MLTCIVLDDTTPPAHYDGQRSRGSAPPTLPYVTSPKKTGGCEYRSFQLPRPISMSRAGDVFLSTYPLFLSIYIVC